VDTSQHDVTDFTARRRDFTKTDFTRRREGNVASNSWLQINNQASQWCVCTIWQHRQSAGKPLSSHYQVEVDPKTLDGRANSPGYGKNVREVGNPQPSSSGNKRDAVQRLDVGGCTPTHLRYSPSLGGKPPGSRGKSFVKCSYRGERLIELSSKLTSIARDSWVPRSCGIMPAS